jgi:hypothetical protein
MLMLVEVAKLERLDLDKVPVTKTAICGLLFGHYLKVGLLEPATDLNKPSPVLPELDPKMPLKTLIAIAEAEGVKLRESDTGTKADYIAAISAKRAADNPGPRSEERK